MALDPKALIEDCKSDIKNIAKKVYSWSKEALIEAAKETKTPIDDFALDALIKAYDEKILAKLEAI